MSEGVTHAAPVLIVQYIEEHGYLPPEVSPACGHARNTQIAWTAEIEAILSAKRSGVGKTEIVTEQAA